MAKPLLWGLASGLVCFVGLGSFLGLASGPVSLIFQTLSVAHPPPPPPPPCVRCTWAKVVTFLASGAISTCLLGAGLVRAWSSSLVL